MKWRYGAVTTDLSSVLRPPSSVLCPHPRMGIALNLRRLRGLATAVALLVLAVVAPVAQAQRSGSVQRDVSVERIEIRSQAIETFDPREAGRTNFGALTFRGGLILESDHRAFGGLSGLRVAADGRFLSVSDKGTWLRGRIVARNGRPIAITDAEIAPILGADGRPLRRRGWYDAEALAWDNGAAYVGIERVNQILRFDYAKDGLHARGQPIAVPPGVKTLPHNQGIECLAVAPAGTPLAGALIALSERGLDARGNLLGFLIGPGGGTFTLKRSDEFDVSDCAFTPRGDLLVLERRFSWMSGLAMRIRGVPLAALKPGALADGRQLIFADMGAQIDNMEGLSVHRATDGALVLTVVSDDNFSPLQRTLLLQFTLIGE